MKRSKTALITGGAKRLGKEITISLASIGYNLFINYNSTTKTELEILAKELEKYNIDFEFYKADISNVSKIERMFQEFGKKYNKLDIMVNNSAIFRHIDFFEIGEDEFDEFIGINLKGTLFCSKEAAKLMKRENDESYPQIINIASLGGILNWTGYIPYCISKAGVIKLTELLSLRLAPDILVNAIAPATIYIDNDRNENVNIKEREKYPLKKFGKAEDITSVIKFLANENKFITGHTFVVDGGRALNK